MDVKKINVILDDFENTNPTLYRHSERVAMICYAFAQEIKLQFKEREIAYFSGMLHDIIRFYLKDCEEFIDDDYDDIIMDYEDEFSVLIPILKNNGITDEDSIEKYGYNVNIIKLILDLSNRYDELRINGLTHEKSCEFLRNEFSKNNNMVTSLLKTIIKNKLNHEY